MTGPERERNSALRIARARARRGLETEARRWLEIAGGFAEPSERQIRGLETAILEGRAGYIHPGQLRLTDHAAA